MCLKLLAIAVVSELLIMEIGTILFLTRGLWTNVLKHNELKLTQKSSSYMPINEF